MENGVSTDELESCEEGSAFMRRLTLNSLLDFFIKPTRFRKDCRTADVSFFADKEESRWKNEGDLVGLETKGGYLSVS